MSVLAGQRLGIGLDQLTFHTQRLILREETPVQLATILDANRRFSCESSHGCHFQEHFQFVQREKLPETRVGKQKRATASSFPQSEGKKRQGKGKAANSNGERRLAENVS
jgi:hypothetical protein